MTEQRNTDAVILFLIVSLIILLLIVLYRLLLRYLSKDMVRTEDFCVLYPLENSPTGITEFYFTVPNEQPVFVKFQILDSNWNEIATIKEEEFSKGGHIIRYDIDQLPPGIFYFGIKTKSQETFKKFEKAN